MHPLFRINTLLALAIVLLLASCNKTNKQGKLVPSDAAFVLHINGQSLNEKLPWDEIKKNELFKKINADTTIPAFAKNVLDNPDNSGVDIRSDLILFAQKDSAGGIVAFEGTLKDAVKFRLFNLDASKGGSESEKDGIHFISKAPGCVGWNKEKFVYLFDAPQMNKHTATSYTDDTTVPVKNRDILAACKAIFDLKENNSLGNDEKFTSLMNKNGDAHLWVNTEQIYKGMAGDGELSMLKMDKLYEGNIMTATANFESGKINVDYTTYVGKDLKAIFKKYSGGNIDDDMLKRIPSKNVAVAMALHFKPEGIKELINLTGMEGIVNIGLVFMGFSLDDFIKANKGDISFALTDIRSKKDSTVYKGMDGKDKVYNNMSYEPDFMFAAAIGDKDAFNLLIKAGKRLSKDKMDNGDSTITYTTSDKYFAIGNSKDNITKYLAGNSNNSPDFISHLSGNPFGGYINLQYIMKAMEMQITKDSNEKIIYAASLKMWDNIYIKGGQYDDGGINYSFEINMLDKNTNSLKQLNQYLGLVGNIMEEQKKEEAHNYREMKELYDKKIKLPPPPPVIKKKKKNK